jgi:hypothetical protein
MSSTHDECDRILALTMTTILLVAIIVLLALILVVVLYGLPDATRSTLAWRVKIITLWFWFGLSVIAFGLGMLLVWIAVSNNSPNMGWGGAGLMLAGLSTGWWPAVRLDNALTHVLRIAEYLIAGGLAVELLIGKLSASAIASAPLYAGLFIAVWWLIVRAFWIVVTVVYLKGEKFSYQFPNRATIETTYRTRTPGLIVVPFPGRARRYYVVHEASGMPVSPQGEAMWGWQAFVCARGLGLKSIGEDWTRPAKEIGICRRLPIEMPAKKVREREKFEYTSPTGRVVIAYRTRTPGILLVTSDTNARRYCLVHERSGLPLSDQKPMRKWVAFRLANAIGAFVWVDWTLSAEEIENYLEKTTAEAIAGLQ